MAGNMDDWRVWVPRREYKRTATESSGIVLVGEISVGLPTALERKLFET